MRMSRFGTFNAVLPPEGPVGYPVALDFSKSSEIEVNMTEEIDGGKLSYVSGFYFDNLDNPYPVLAVVAGSGQRIRIPANKGVYAPALITDSATVTFSTTKNPDGIRCQVFMVNFPVWPCVIG